MPQRQPSPLTASQFVHMRDALETTTRCLNPTCEQLGDEGQPGMVGWADGRGRPPRFCSNTCRMQFNYTKGRLVSAWEQVEWSKGQATPPASKRDLDKVQAQIEWLLLGYGVTDVRAVASLPDQPTVPLRLHLLGPDDDPDEWAIALRQIVEAAAFYEGRQVPDEVRSALRAARAGARLRPYYEWLTEQDWRA